MQQLYKVKNSLLFIIISLFFTLNAQEKSDKMYVNEYLKLGPVTESFPVFSDLNKITSLLKNNLKAARVDVTELHPTVNDIFEWQNGNNLIWGTANANENKVILSSEKLENPQILYLAFYITSERWAEADLKIKSPQMLSVFFDGKMVDSKDSFEKVNEQGEVLPGLITTKLKMENGKHVVVLKCLSSQEMVADWYLESWLEYDKKYAGQITLSTSPQYYVNFGELLDNIKVTGVSTSPDGNIAAIKLSKRDLVEDKQENWVELIETEEGGLIYSLSGGMNIEEVEWAPIGNSLAYQVSGSKGASIWIYDLSNGKNTEVLKNVEDLSGFYWTPDAKSIIFSTTTRPEQPDKNFKKWERIEDKWPYGRDITTLHQVFLPNGTVRDLTSSDKSVSYADVSPDGSKLLFTTWQTEPTKWPFENTTYYLTDLKSLKTDSLFTMIFSGGAEFSPDGQKLVIKGGPSSFEGSGKNLPTGVFPNDYDNQLYIYDISTHKVEPVTKNFNPSVDDFYWVRGSNSIYFTTTDRSFKHLYKYNLNTKKISYVDLGVEYVESISFSGNGKIALFIGESSNVQRKIYSLNLSGEDVDLLLDPDFNSFRNIKLGEVNDFIFRSSKGKEILGRAYYPPNFDSSKKYPLIVNYYGGTGPIERNFEGRYPLNIWAANGYVVYVLQPSGATGFGQEFSAAHVNDWGNTTADEIIEGTKAFLKEHDFIDPTRVGCIGASYGGFMTLSVLTKTDIFTAGISHAGISTLTSYWGEGYWGHSYSSVATANSYPWNRKDIYVDYSPIYSADKINTPLLLLHGNIDPNVPKGESWTMYTALKILGKDVELIEIDQQGHWIMDYHKRQKWSRTILAYFDKYLKGQPEWWNELYQ